MSDFAWVRRGLISARAEVSKGYAPRQFVKRVGALSLAEKRAICAEVPHFAREYAAILGSVVRLAETKRAEAEVRGA